MKILTVHGSQDSDGNSARLLRASLEGIGQAGGAEVKSININEYGIAPVWKNYFGDVMKKQTDKVKDDMPALKEMMLNADIILLATPVFWYQLPGALKLFVDRWSDFINPDFSTELKGKGLALLSTHSGINVMNSSNILQSAMEGTARFLGMIWMGGVDGRSQMMWEWDDDPSAEQARLFGKKLAGGINLIGQKVL
jgi:multimeric flavodoxin WrbA